MSWYFSNVHAWHYSISSQEGRVVRVNLRFSDPTLGGRFHTTEISGAWQEYLTPPWARLHALALLWSGGIGIGDKRDFFGLGGFFEQDVLQTLFLSRPQCCTFLRGYPPNSFVGDSYQIVVGRIPRAAAADRARLPDVPDLRPAAVGRGVRRRRQRLPGPLHAVGAEDRRRGRSERLPQPRSTTSRRSSSSATRTASRRRAATSGTSSSPRPFDARVFATLRAVTGSFVGLLLGVAMGARHALDPDHLAAVSVLAADAPGPRRGALLGALWGIGHAAALLGTGLVLASLAAEMPAALADAFELAVAAMLIVLGARAVARALRSAGAGSPWLHAHAGVCAPPRRPARPRPRGAPDARAAPAGRRHHPRSGGQRRADRAGARAAALGAPPLRLHGAVQRRINRRACARCPASPAGRSRASPAIPAPRASCSAPWAPRRPWASSGPRPPPAPDWRAGSVAERPASGGARQLERALALELVGEQLLHQRRRLRPCRPTMCGASAAANSAAV